MSKICPDDDLQAALNAAATRGEADAQAALALLLERYPEDARLHFLRGSLLAASGDYAGGREAIAAAVALQPDYRIARFQLGFLDFTSGDAASAEAAWAPLLDTEEGDALRLFAEGLVLLAHDDFAGAAGLIERGIEANADNAPLNADMRRLLDAMAPHIPEKGAGADEPLSLTQLALQQSAARATRH